MLSFPSKMLSSISRSSYICSQCRTRIFRNSLTRKLPLTTGKRSFTLSPLRLQNENTFSHLIQNEAEMAGLVSGLLKSNFGERKPWVQKTPVSLATKYTAIPDQLLPQTWAEAGLRPVVFDTLVRAFPNTVRPTNIQKRMMLALCEGNSVAVRDLPGTGKSFAVALWLLSLQRSMGAVNSSGERRPTTTALIIAPGIDLVEQYTNIISGFLEATNSPAILASPAAYVQKLYRDTDSVAEQIALLRKYPNPHIIVATPTMLLDLLAHEDPSVRELLDLKHLKAIVCDEIDSAMPRMHLWKRGSLDGEHNWGKDAPLQILMDYIVKTRKAAIGNNDLSVVIQPQLVFLSSTLTGNQMKRLLCYFHPNWLDVNAERIVHQDRKSFNRAEGFAPPFWGAAVKKFAAQSLIVMGDEMGGHFKQRVVDNIRHHVLAYDPSSGFLRDAPLPPLQEWSDEEKVAAIEDAAEIDASAEPTGRPRQEAGTEWDSGRVGDKNYGYPEEIAVEVLEKLLEHDKWPRNVIVGIGIQSSMLKFREKCADIGLDARFLRFEDWRKNAKEEGRIPLGRTDMLIDRHTRSHIDSFSGGSRDKTIIWIMNPFTSRGLDIPGVYYAYILHRIEKARDYINYCGRVARWPFGSSEEVKDPRELGEDRRKHGKVVSVILEERVVPMGNKPVIVDKPYMSVNLEGKNGEQMVWLDEALRMAKIECYATPYFGQAEDDAGKSVVPPKETKRKNKSEANEGPVRALRKKGVKDKGIEKDTKKELKDKATEKDTKKEAGRGVQDEAIFDQALELLEGSEHWAGNEGGGSGSGIRSGRKGAKKSRAKTSKPRGKKREVLGGDYLT